jgi:acetyl esterase/lipase
LEKRVTPSTPPAFIALSQDDKVVDPNNSIVYYQALLRNSVPGELHIYTKGGHGWGFGSRFETEEDKLKEQQRADFDAALERWLKYIEE